MSELPVKSDCVFCNIANRLDPSDPTELLYEDEEVCVFRDIRPASRLHVLAIPKKHIKHAKALKTEHKPLVEKLLSAAKTVVSQQGLAVPDTLFGYHQPPFCTVYHLHLHAIAPEREMSQYSRMMFPKNTYSFVSPEYVASRL